MSKSKINFLLLGGGSFLFYLAHYLFKKHVNFVIFTDELHLGNNINDVGTLRHNLEANGISCFSVSAISRNHIERYLNDDTVGLSISAHWIFQKDFIDCFKGKFYNLHISKLPLGRGGGGPTWKILSQNRSGGVTIHKVSEGIDDGDIVMQEEFTYSDECVIPADYYEYEKPIVKDFIIKFVKKILSREQINVISQDHSRGEYFPRINTSINGYIDWNWPAEDIKRFIDAFDDPHEGASTFLGQTRVRLKKCIIQKNEGSFHPFQSGIVYRIFDQDIFVAVQKGTVVVREVYDENGNDIKNKIRLGVRFYTPIEYIEKAKMTKVIYSSSGLKTKT